MNGRAPEEKHVTTGEAFDALARLCANVPIEELKSVEVLLAFVMQCERLRLSGRVGS